MGFNIIAFILIASVTIRRMIWFFTAIFIIVILWKSLRHRKALDLDEFPLLMLPCGFEWFWREYAYRIVGEIANPYAYWWERRLAPALILGFALFIYNFFERRLE